MYQTPPPSAGSSTDPYLSDATPRSRFRDSLSFTGSESSEDNARSVMRSEMGDRRLPVDDRIWKMESELEMLRRQKDVSMTRKVDIDRVALKMKRGGIQERPRVTTQAEQIEGDRDLKSQLSSLHLQMSQMQTLLSSFSDRISVPSSHHDLQPASPYDKRFESARESFGFGYKAKARSPVASDSFSLVDAARKSEGYASIDGGELDRVIQRAVTAEIERRDLEDRRLKDRELEAHERRAEGEARKKTNIEKELDRAFEVINRLDDEKKALKAKLAALEGGTASSVAGERESSKSEDKSVRNEDRGRANSNQSAETSRLDDLIRSFSEIAQALKYNGPGMREEHTDRKERKGPHIRDLGRERPAHPVVVNIERGVADFDNSIKHLESYVNYVELETENTNWDNQAADSGGDGSNWLPHILQLGKDRPAHVAILNLRKSLDVVKEKLHNLDVEVQLTERRRDDAKRIHRAMMTKASQSGPQQWGRAVSRPLDSGREWNAPPPQWVPMTPSPYWHQYGTPRYGPSYGGPYSQQSFAAGPVRSNSLNMPGPPDGAGDVLSYQFTPNPPSMHEPVIPSQQTQQRPFIPPSMTPMLFQPVIPNQAVIQPSPASGVQVPPDGLGHTGQRHPSINGVLGISGVPGLLLNENRVRRSAVSDLSHRTVAFAGQDGNRQPLQVVPKFSAALHFSPEHFDKRNEVHSAGGIPNDSANSMRFNVPQTAPPKFAQPHISSTPSNHSGEQLPTGHNESANTMQDVSSSNTLKGNPEVEPLQYGSSTKNDSQIDGKNEEIFSSLPSKSY